MLEEKLENMVQEREREQINNDQTRGHVKWELVMPFQNDFGAWGGEMSR